MSIRREHSSRTRRRAWLGMVVPLALAGTLVVAGGAAGVLASDHLDAPDGFTPDVIASHAEFVDDVAVQLRFRYDEPGGNQGATVSSLRDAGTVVVAEVTWEPGGTSGWHTHPGPVVVSVVEGELEVTNADDCVPRTYTAGEAWVDPGQGNVHTAVNPGTGKTRVVATFFGVPDGELATEHVAPADC